MWRAMGAQARLWRVYRAAVRATAQIQTPAGDLGNGPRSPSSWPPAERPSTTCLLMKLKPPLYFLYGLLMWLMRRCSLTSEAAS